MCHGVSAAGYNGDPNSFSSYLPNSGGVGPNARDGYAVLGNLSSMGMNSPQGVMINGPIIAASFILPELIAARLAGAAEGTALRWGPLNGGPLSDAVANTFRGGSYTESALSGETTLYRSYGGTAGELGSYWTRTPPAGPLQATMDSALNPAWGNTAQSVSTIRVPAGTTIYEGFAAPQGGLLGGGSQVYIPKVNPNWLVHP